MKSPTTCRPAPRQCEIDELSAWPGPASSQSMVDEPDAVRAALNERKVVDRAKGLLMVHWQLSEDEAYRQLRRMAMNRKKRIVDAAKAVIAMAAMLPAPEKRA